MNRAFLPFRFLPSAALVALLGADLRRVAVMAVRAVLKHRRSLEIAHQQIVFRNHHIAISTRISQSGELYVDLDLGDPSLADRLILEEDLSRAFKSAKSNSRVLHKQRGSH